MNIVITGTNHGLGFELVKKFAENRHRVAACYYPGAATEELRTLVGRYENLVKLISMDVTKENDIAVAAELIRVDSYSVDAVVSNAGILCNDDRHNDVLRMKAVDLRTSIEVNLVGPAMVIKYFYPLMKKSMNSIFITVTSEAGSIINSGSNFPAYSISKTAANKLVAVFRETASDIRVFAMHPGRMNTAMGRTTAQIEAWESAEGIYGIVTGENKALKENDWFIDYQGKSMQL